MMRRSLARLATLAAGMLVAAAGCASGGSQVVSDEEGCALRAEDAVFVQDGQLFRDCAVDRKARLLTPRVRPDFTDRTTTCHSVRVEFVVGSDGVPEAG